MGHKYCKPRAEYHIAHNKDWQNVEKPDGFKILLLGKLMSHELTQGPPANGKTTLQKQAKLLTCGFSPEVN